MNGFRGLFHSRSPLLDFFRDPRSFLVLFNRLAISRQHFRGQAFDWVSVHQLGDQLFGQRPNPVGKLGVE